MLEDLVARDAPIRDQLIQEADSLKFISLTEVCGRLFRFFFFGSYGHVASTMRSGTYIKRWIQSSGRFSKPEGL